MAVRHSVHYGGTRTLLCPEGDGTRADEVQGNDFAAFAAEVCIQLHASGRLFAFESSAPSGRYPKIWDLPCMQRLREQTGARLVPLHMCAWHLQPWDCAPGSFTRKSPGGWFPPTCFPGFICFFRVTALGSAPTISMRSWEVPVIFLGCRPLGGAAVDIPFVRCLGSCCSGRF